MKKTEQLLKTIQMCKNYETFISENQNDLIPLKKLGETLQKILEQKNLKKSDVIRMAGIDRGYAYDIFSDKKQPSRDKVLLLCLSAAFSFEETQTLLKQTGYPLLYARTPRDSAIIFAFEHHMSVMDANELLYDLHHEILS